MNRWEENVSHASACFSNWMQRNIVLGCLRLNLFAVIHVSNDSLQT